MNPIPGGGAPEGVLAAAALLCTGGQMQGCPQLDIREKRARVETMEVGDPSKVYSLGEMASGDVIFAATGVTDGDLLDGVRFYRDGVETHTLVMPSASKTVREIRARHHDGSKSGL